jgi:hypothetical protein
MGVNEMMKMNVVWVNYIGFTLALILVMGCSRQPGRLIPETVFPDQTSTAIPTGHSPQATTTALPESGNWVTGWVRDEFGPVPGARVRFQTTGLFTLTDEEGRFRLEGFPTTTTLSITACATGYFCAGPVVAAPGDYDVEIQLHRHPREDNPGYSWVPSLSRPGGEDGGSCADCHSLGDSDLALSLPVDEWLRDAHSQTGMNTRFLTMYTGSDVSGQQSPPTRYGYNQDYGRFPLRPDPELPYYGPGYKLDFPETFGNCAACHTPAASIDAPYNTDPTVSNGLILEGISCDFCHKVWDVNLDLHSGLPFKNMPGVLSFSFRRPPEGHQFFAGPFDDVAPGEDTYSPLQTQSQFCAPCHYGVFWDEVVYDSFGEWLLSPYSSPENGQTCQDCHMPRLGVDHFALPEQGGLTRDPATIFSHRMPGASDETLLRNAVSMEVAASMEKGILNVQVTLTNDRTGHAVPTDSPLRHLILLVSAEDEGGRQLGQIDGPQLPDWCGVGDQKEGNYAGQPGMVYAKVLAEKWTEVSPTGAYWNPTYLISDNRLQPLSSAVTNYSFELLDQSPVLVRVRLIYRRAFIELSRQKGWQTPDILMEEKIIEVAP